MATDEIDGRSMNDGQRPTDLYRREVVWVRPEPEPPLLEIWHSFDVQDWDRWIDELPAMERSDGVVSVKLFAGHLSWGHDLSGQMLRITERAARRKQ